MKLFTNKVAEAPPATKRVDAPTFSEMGKTGLRENNGWVTEEFIPCLQWPRAGAVYKEMSSNDPVITAILLCSRQLIRNVTWTVQSASKENADEEAAEFLRSCMNDMSCTWSDLIDEITSYFEYGFSYHEIVYKRRLGKTGKSHTDSKYSDGRIGWRKIPGRAQDTLDRWKFDDEGGIEGMYQYTSKGSVFIPINKSLLFRTTAAKNNPEGKSFLRGAYRPWYFKKHIEEIEGIGIERDLAGLPVTTAPEGVDIYDKENPKAVEALNNALKMVTSIRRDRNEGVVLPSGWKLDLLSSGSSRQFDTSTVINRYDQRIAITMLADIVMLGADKVGSFALAKVKQSMLAAALNAQLASVCDIFNRYAIPRLFALNNFPNITNYPKLVAGSVVAPDLNELGNYIKALAGAKMPIFPDVDVENYLRRVAGLPETSDEDAERAMRVSRSNQTQSSSKEGGESGEK